MDTTDVFVQRNRTGSANARLDLPLFQQQMEKKKVCGEWLSRCQLSCFALSAVSHFKFWFCLIYICISFMFVKRTRTRNAIKQFAGSGGADFIVPVWDKRWVKRALAC